jgi:hypothetical protein
MLIFFVNYLKAQNADLLYSAKWIDISNLKTLEGSGGVFDLDTFHVSVEEINFKIIFTNRSGVDLKLIDYSTDGGNHVGMFTATEEKFFHLACTKLIRDTDTMEVVTVNHKGNERLFRNMSLAISSHNINLRMREGPLSSTARFIFSYEDPADKVKKETTIYMTFRYYVKAD